MVTVTQVRDSETYDSPVVCVDAACCNNFEYLTLHS